VAFSQRVRVFEILWLRSLNSSTRQILAHTVSHQDFWCVSDRILLCYLCYLYSHWLACRYILENGDLHSLSLYHEPRRGVFTLHAEVSWISDRVRYGSPVWTASITELWDNGGWIYSHDFERNLVCLRELHIYVLCSHYRRPPVLEVGALPVRASPSTNSDAGPFTLTFRDSNGLSSPKFLEQCWRFQDALRFVKLFMRKNSERAYNIR
jgi:hypothetical protein